MTRKKKAIALFITLAILSTIGYSVFIGFPRDGSIVDHSSEELIPHPYNSLNWWDLAWVFTTVSDLVTYLSAIELNPVRHHDANPDGYYADAEYLQNLLQGWGIEVTFEGSSDTLLGYQQGYSEDNRAIVFGAPLDTTPGGYLVNQASGVAVLTQIADILHNFRLPIDVYYCYYAYSFYMEDEVRVLQGSQDIVNYLEQNDVNVIASYNFEYLLFFDPLQPSSESLHADYSPSSVFSYQSSKYLVDLLDTFLLQNGNDILTSGATTAYSADYLSFLDAGIPAINIRSGHIIDSEFPPQDAIYSSDYNRDNAASLAQALASLAIFLGNSGNHEPIKQTLTTSLQPDTSVMLRTVMSHSQVLEISGTMNETSSVALEVVSGDSTIAQGVVSGLEYSLTTGTSTQLGPLQVIATNMGDSPITITFDITYQLDTDGNGEVDSTQYIWNDPVPALDWDQDDLSDKDEIIAGTDIFVPDTDMDSIPDGFEVAYGLNPLRDDTQEDLDSDGLSNIREYTLGIHPNETDSDHDSMDDLWEVTFLTDPTIDDSQLDPDNDTLTNLDEYTYGADPYSIDGDFDGILDVEEVELGTNALSSDSDADGLQDRLELIEGLNPLVPDYDVDFQVDGSDRNPRINQLLVIFGLAMIPVLIGSLYLSRKLK